MADPSAGRRPSWVTLAYYYVVALIGLTIVITGVLIAINSFFDAIFFDSPPSSEFEVFDQSRGDKVRSGFKGLVTAAVGVPILWWHIKEARRAERPPAAS